MNVELKLKQGFCSVQKQTTDKPYKQSGWADAESTFLYHVQQELKAQGFDVIKKRMYKDGHMVDDTQQYIRARDGSFGVYNSSYAIWDAGLRFNELKAGESLMLSAVDLKEEF